MAKKKAAKKKTTRGGGFSIMDLTGVLSKDFADLVNAKEVERVSTGIPYVDRIISGDVLGGGIPMGGVIEISGPFSSGKTTMALTIMRRFLRHFSEDEGAIYFDYENSVDARYAKSAFGISLDNSDPRVWYAQPSSIGEARRVLAKIFKTSEKEGVCPVRLVVFDSVAAMNPEVSLEAVIEDGEGRKDIGLQARDLSLLFMQFIGLFKKWGVTVILCNQLRSVIKMNKYEGGPDEETSGGKAIKFYCWTRMTLKPAGKVRAKAWDSMSGEMKDRDLYNVVRVTTIKNKVAAPFIQDEVHIRYGYGFDNAYTTVVKAAKYGAYHPDHKLTEADRQRTKQPYVTKDSPGKYVLWQYETGGINPASGEADPLYCQVEDKKNSTGRRIVKKTELLSASNLITLSEALVRPENKEAWNYLLTEILKHYEADDMYMTPAEKAALVLEVEGHDDVDALENEETAGVDAVFESPDIDLDALTGEESSDEKDDE